MKLLIAGRSGQVARALARCAGERGLDATLMGRPEVDLEGQADLSALVGRHAPDIVINAAAYTAVDKAESEPDRAFAINAEGARRLAEAAADHGAPIIQVSTDYVFSGAKAEPYVETDSTDPASVYGASKLKGEQLVCAANERALVARTSWVYDAHGANFVRSMLRLAKTNQTLRVVGDQYGGPTSARELARGLLDVAEQAVRGTHFGIYHCAGAGDTTWADFARAIFSEALARGGPAAEVVEITTRDYPTTAKRPANSRLDCDKLVADYGVRLRPWRGALADCMDEIAAGGWSVE